MLESEPDIFISLQFISKWQTLQYLRIGLHVITCGVKIIQIRVQPEIEVIRHCLEGTHLCICNRTKNKRQIQRTVCRPPPHCSHRVRSRWEQWDINQDWGGWLQPNDGSVSQNICGKTWRSHTSRDKQLHTEMTDFSCWFLMNKQKCLNQFLLCHHGLLCVN